MIKKDELMNISLTLKILNNTYSLPPTAQSILYIFVSNIKNKVDVKPNVR